jgi:hypothetical protein
MPGPRNRCGSLFRRLPVSPIAWTTVGRNSTDPLILPFLNHDLATCHTFRSIAFRLVPVLAAVGILHAYRILIRYLAVLRGCRRGASQTSDQKHMSVAHLTTSQRCRSPTDATETGSILSTACDYVDQRLLVSWVHVGLKPLCADPARRRIIKQRLSAKRLTTVSCGQSVGKRPVWHPQLGDEVSFTHKRISHAAVNRMSGEPAFRPISANVAIMPGLEENLVVSSQLYAIDLQAHGYTLRVRCRLDHWIIDGAVLIPLVRCQSISQFAVEGSGSGSSKVLTSRDRLLSLSYDCQDTRLMSLEWL